MLKPPYRMLDDLLTAICLKGKPLTFKPSAETYGSALDEKIDLDAESQNSGYLQERRNDEPVQTE